ncbi:unnamed protein product [Somion occarium]|uniref:Uncharacterized protein n=1 Tax=Somion occarium TaxID=3059160 RepID=A0ABP1E3F0_9APHY
MTKQGASFPNPAGALLRSTPLRGYDSSNSLDINTYLNATLRQSSDNFLITSGPSLSFSDTAYSLDDNSLLELATPPPLSAAKFLRTPILSTLDQVVSSNSFESDILISIPTPPRVKAMLMEPICVSQWTERLDAEVPPQHSPWEGYANSEDKTVAPPWIPDGSIFPPDAFGTILRHSHHRLLSPAPTWGELVAYPQLSVDALADDRSETSTDTRSREVMTVSPLLPRVGSKFGLTSPGSSFAVPTIMISNSAAMLPLSLESSYSLMSASPLAVRRGQNLPAPLSIVSGKPQDSDYGKDMPYPGIPSPFLGDHTPTFEFSASTKIAPFGLDAMCDDLRSRIPAIRPESLQLELVDTVSTSSETTEDERDEWAFANGLETSFGKTSSDIDVHKAPPVGNLKTLASPRKAQDSPKADSSVLLAEDTLRDSTNNDYSSNSISEPRENMQRTSVPDAAKLQRRRTVIIETPEDGPRRRTRVTLDLSHLADCGETTVDGQDSVPFDPTPLERLSLSPFDVTQSTPSKRPPSSATLRPPAKGILKEKKSVRFSVLPSMHEYVLEDKEVEDEDKPSSPPARPPTPVGRRLSTAPKSSLRQGSPPRQNIILESAAKDHRVSFPKHPGVKSIFKDSPPHGKRESAALSVKFGTPPVNKRPPLRPLNGKQSQPPPATSPAKGGRFSMVKKDVSEPKKMRPAGTVSLPPKPRSSLAQNENTASRESTLPSPEKARRGSAPATPKTRMPFRSMFMKLRSG